MPSGAVRPVQEIQQAVRGHLQRSPLAADTLVGIRQWWLPEGLQSMPMDLIRHALDDMVAAGEMRCDTLPDGTPLYSRSAPRRTHDGNAA